MFERLTEELLDLKVTERGDAAGGNAPAAVPLCCSLAISLCCSCSSRDELV